MPVNVVCHDSSGFVGGFSVPERGNSGFDVRHRLVVNFIYDLPLRSATRTSIVSWVIGPCLDFSIANRNPVQYFWGTDSGSGSGPTCGFRTIRSGLSDLAAATNDPRTYTGPARSLFSNPCPANRTNTSPTTRSAASGTSADGKARSDAISFMDRRSTKSIFLLSSVSR